MLSGSPPPSAPISPPRQKPCILELPVMVGGALELEVEPVLVWVVRLQGLIQRSWNPEISHPKQSPRPPKKKEILFRVHC